MASCLFFSAILPVVAAVAAVAGVAGVVVVLVVMLGGMPVVLSWLVLASSVRADGVVLCAVLVGLQNPRMSRV